MTGRRSRLRAARKAAGLSLGSFAEAVGVDRSTAIRWEAGQSEPQPRQRPKMAKALNRSLDGVDELLLRDGDQPEAPTGSAAAGRPVVDGRVEHVLRNPRSVDLVAVAELLDQVLELDARYETAPSSLLVGQAGQCLGHVMLLKGYATGRVTRELLAAEAQAATLVGQLVWDASQRREHAIARWYFEQARTSARQVRDPAAEGLTFLRDAIVALYGERDPRRGLDLAVQAATVGRAGSSVIAGLGLLHAAEAYAMMGARRACEQALSEAESLLTAVEATDPAAELFSPTQPGRMAGSCYLFLGEPKRAQSILEETVPGFLTASKNKAIVLGNLSLSHVRQGEIDGAVEVLHSAIEVAEATRGGGGLNIVFDAGRELGPWRDLASVRDVHDRLLTLMTAA